MSEVLGQAVLELSTDNSKLNHGVSESEGALSRFGETAKHLAEIIGVTFAAEKIIDFGKEAVQGAAQLQKSVEVIHSMFGPASEEVTSFGESAAKSFGISAAAADATSAKFGILFTNMGVGKQSAADMTIGWEELAGSLSKIKGVDPSEVMDKITLAAQGNTRGLKELGITITSHAIQVQAMSDGYGDSVAKLTAAEKATVVYQLATAHLSDYMDEAKKHSGDLADQQRVLTAEWSNAKDKLGAELMPAVTSVTTALVGLLGWLQNGESVTQRFTDVMNRLGISAGTQKKIIEDLGNAWDDVKSATKTAVDTMSSLWDKFGSNIMTSVRDNFAAVQKIIGGVLDVIRGIFHTFHGLFTGDWDEMWNGLKQVVTGVWNIIKGYLETVWNAIVLLASTTWKTVGSTITGIWHSLEGAATTAWNAVVDAISRAFFKGVAAVVNVATIIKNAVIGFFSDAGQWLLNAGGEIVHGLVNGLKGAVGSAVGAAGDLAGSVKGAVTGVFGIHSPSTVFHEIGENLMQGLVNGIIDGSVAVVEQAKMSMQEMLNAASEKVKSARTTFASDFGALADAALQGFQARANAWKSPSQILLDRAQLQDDILKYTLAVKDGLTAINDDKNAIDAAQTAVEVAAAANTGDLKNAATQKAYDDAVAALGKANGQLTTDQGTYEDAKRGLYEFNLAQKAATETAAHDKTVADSSTHLGNLLTQLQTELPHQIEEWVKTHTDIHGKIADFHANTFLLTNPHYAALLKQIQDELGKHSPEWKKAQEAILAEIRSHEGEIRDAGADAARSYAQGLRDAAAEVGQAAKDVFGGITGMFGGGGGSSGGGVKAPSLDTGGEVLATGLAVVHKGETYSGVDGSYGTGGRGGDVIFQLDKQVLGKVAISEILRAQRQNVNVGIV